MSGEKYRIVNTIPPDISYITDVISVIKNDNLIFKFNNASSTIVILEEDNPDYIYIMMPMSV